MPIKFLNEINNFTIKGESGVSTLDLDGSEFDAVLIKAGLAELIEYDLSLIHISEPTRPY